MTDIKVYENISIVTFSDVPSRKRYQCRYDLADTS